MWRWNNIFNEPPVATCCVFKDKSDDKQEAEKNIYNVGGKSISLHEQCRASAFYRKNGYVEYGETDDDEGCPHIWMQKNLEKE